MKYDGMESHSFFNRQYFASPVSHWLRPFVNKRAKYKQHVHFVKETTQVDEMYGLRQKERYTWAAQMLVTSENKHARRWQYVVVGKKYWTDFYVSYGLVNLVCLVKKCGKTAAVANRAPYRLNSVHVFPL